MMHKLLSNSEPLLPGDFVLTHGDTLLDRLTQIATHSQWNHAALITDISGELVEATAKGLRTGSLESYNSNRFLVRITDFTSADRVRMVNYAKMMLGLHESYGILTIISIVFKILTHSRLVVTLDKTLICSQFVANCLFIGGYPWTRDTTLITPADLFNTFVKVSK